MKIIKNILKKLSFLYPLIDILFLPITFLGALWLRLVKFLGLKKFKLTKRILLNVGVMPIVNHYYEPFYYQEKFDKKKRTINHLKISSDEQIKLLQEINHASELSDVSVLPVNGKRHFYYDNHTFSYGDADLYYYFIRHFKPRKVIEIGSGFSTLIAKKAVDKNKTADSVITELSCVEPYENDWLEELDINIIRHKVENVETGVFNDLKENDILFIDSSHVIRPGGDVLTEIFEILPLLNKGVFIHFHDIFFPRHYPDKWVNDELRLWNEQYILEAFLSYNNSFEILVSLNLLSKEKFKEVSNLFPKFPEGANPSSFWIKKC